MIDVDQSDYIDLQEFSRVRYCCEAYHAKLCLEKSYIYLQAGAHNDVRSRRESTLSSAIMRSCFKPCTESGFHAECFCGGEKNESQLQNSGGGGGGVPVPLPSPLYETLVYYLVSRIPPT